LACLIFVAGLSLAPLALTDDGFYVIPVKQAASTNYYTLPGAVFIGDGTADRTPTFPNNPDGSIAYAGGSGYYYASVNLPDGVRLTEFRVYCTNMGTSSNFEVNLMRFDRPATSPLIMATASIPYFTSYASIVAATISPDTIDNMNYSYAAVIKFTDGAQKVNAVRITYAPH
jgi:hypothetical protein